MISLATKDASCPYICLIYGYNYGKSISLSKQDYILDILCRSPSSVRKLPLIILELQHEDPPYKID